MPYKTIILQLIEDQPSLHRHLVEHRLLHTALDRCSRTLKARHEDLKNEFLRRTPGRNSMQIESETLEIAIAEFLEMLPNEAEEPLSLDGAMAFLGAHTPTE